VVAPSGEARAELLDHLAQLELETATYRVLHRRGQGWNQARYGAMETASTTMAQYSLVVVPGLLQTADYAREMLAKVGPGIPDPAGLVAGRMQRQQVLYDTSKRFAFVIAEGVLTTRVASSAVMLGQIDRIASLATGLDHIELRILPLGVSPERITMTGFVLLDDQALVETDRTEIPVRDPRDVEWYREAFDGLRRSALHGQEAVGLLRRIGATYSET